MNRYSLLFCACLAFCVVVFGSCASSPSISPALKLEKYGAGSVDETGTANKAGSPAAIQKIRTEEILAQVVMYEADMDAALAARKYAAAIASFDSIADLLQGIPAGLSRLDGDRAKVETALDSIRLEAVSSPSETAAGVAFKKDFTVRAYVLEGDAKTPLVGFECAVSGPSGTEKRTTAADGLAVYTAPVPAKPGKGVLVMSATLTSRESALRDSINLRKEKGFLALAFPHVVSSNAKKFATTISILDFDKNGNPIKSSNPSATILLKPLVQKGFSRIGMADFPSQLASGDEEALLKAAKAQFGSGVRRFIYGTVRIAELVQGADGLWTCTATAKVAVRDFTLDATVFETTVSATASGKTGDAAVAAARTSLAGDMLVQELYYNM